MPGVDGITVCKQLKEDPWTAKIPVLIMTASDSDERRAEALLAGADDLASKPFRPKEFLLRIANKIQKAREHGEKAPVQEILKCGNLTLDLGRLEASIDGRSVQLSVIEIQLLRLLIRHKTQILRRDFLLDAVWHDKDVSDRVVDNHIVSLRKKLTDFDHEIVSVYGAGYGIKPHR